MPLSLKFLEHYQRTVKMAATESKNRSSENVP